MAKFAEIVIGEVHRIHLLGRWVNKGYLACECETAFEMVDAKRRLRW
jgi:hypothetical protein